MKHSVIPIPREQAECKNSQEEIRSLLSRFQINKTTGFSDDYKSVRLSVLIGCFGTASKDGSEIAFTKEDISEYSDNLDISYEQYLRDKLVVFKEKMSKKYPDPLLLGVEPETFIPFLMNLVSDKIEDFNDQINKLQEALRLYNMGQATKEQVRGKLNYIHNTFFPSREGNDYIDTIRERVMRGIM